mmetsp:Transcript_10107/g.29415  ORF Transcript_10107/g.29415 Transcript_10107/m.29415 type:complete len:321 (+) Transcript_10107:1213-2175(+)
MLAEVEVPLGSRELLALGQAYHLDACVCRISHAKGDLVDAVQSVQSRVPIAFEIVLRAILIELGFLHEVRRLPRLGHAEALLEGLLATSSPAFSKGTIFGIDGLSVPGQLRIIDLQPLELLQRHLLALDRLPVVHKLHPREQHVIHSEDLGDKPYLQQACHSLDLRRIVKTNDHTAALVVRLPVQVIHRLGTAVSPCGGVDARAVEAIFKSRHLALIELLRRHRLSDAHRLKHRHPRSLCPPLGAIAGSTRAVPTHRRYGCARSSSTVPWRPDPLDVNDAAGGARGFRRRVPVTRGGLIVLGGRSRQHPILRTRKLDMAS